MPASTFTHPAMFSGDFTITEKSVAMSGPYGWFLTPSVLQLGGTTGNKEGRAEVNLMGFTSIENTLKVGCVYTLDGSFIGRKDGSPATLTYDPDFAVKRRAASQELRSRIRISGNAYVRSGEMLKDTPENGGSRLEVVVKFNGYDEQLGRPIYTDNHVPFSLKCVILSKPHLKNTQKLYRCGRMVFVWGKLVGWHDAQHMAVVSIDEVSLPNGYQGSPNRLDLGNPVASSMHTWATQWQHVHVDDDDLSELDENGHSPPPVLADRSDSDCKISIDEKPRLKLRNRRSKRLMARREQLKSDKKPPKSVTERPSVIKKVPSTKKKNSSKMKRSSS
ncbi:hypothetical protein Pst134EA_000815 [Puccinia striiformis f. sp. tritici]|uniref:hypothetical protein n=1 Tax=Puccinia striiformis f. sp. tritici TaxID=168172 RepID=UPI00200830AB|nr:hypothetical protein Pst134EA_000815 [Puccinia striiformis f. sp. tritici]KAH9473743.1 hypothetical protein Pst134EA_000815 [Puccinia striiformis f. sp. tritici]